MSRPTTSTFRRAIFATVMVSVMVLAVAALSISPAPAAPSGNCTYYNNAQHTTVVGKFGKDCCNNNVAWGVTSPYRVCGGCFICFPPPR